jgi:hypothetical protein
MRDQIHHNQSILPETTMSDLPEIDPRVITAAAEAGASVAAQLVHPPLSASMTVATGRAPATGYENDRPAREAFAKAAIEVYQVWAAPPVKSSTTPQAHAQTIVTRLVSCKALSPLQEMMARESVEEYLNICFFQPVHNGQHVSHTTQDLVKAVRERDTAQANAYARMEALQEAKTRIGRLEEDNNQLIRERDAFKGEIQTTHADTIRHAGMIDSLEKQKESLHAKIQEMGNKIGDLHNEVRRLKKSGGNDWVSFKDRKPTVDDADADGNVPVCFKDGVMGLRDIDSSTMGWDERWWRPASLPVPLPPFVVWKRGLSEREIENMGDGVDLHEVWKQIESYARTLTKPS